MFAAFRRLSLLLGVVAGAPVGACLECRTVDATPLPAVVCDGADFEGELHFDAAATFRSFLRDRCMTQASDDTLDAITNSVDFNTRAAFVAVGSRAGVGRCVQARAAGSVEACEEGLRIVFDDVTTADPVCAGVWTVALSLPRGELRAALADE